MWSNRNSHTAVWCSHTKKGLDISIKLNTLLLHDPANPLLSICETETCTHNVTTALFMTVRNWKQLKWPSIDGHRKTFHGEQGQSLRSTELGKPDLCRQQNEAGPSLTPQTKINTRQIKDPNVRAYTVKPSEESRGESPPDTKFGNDILLSFFLLFGYSGTICGILLPWPETEPRHSAVTAQSPNHWTARGFPSNMTPKAQATKSRSIASTEIKNYCAPKDTLGRLKRRPTHWKAVSAQHLSTKGFTPRMQLNDNKTTGTTGQVSFGGDFSLKEICKQPISHGTDAQHP